MYRTYIYCSIIYNYKILEIIFLFLSFHSSLILSTLWFSFHFWYDFVFSSSISFSVQSTCIPFLPYPLHSVLSFCISDSRLFSYLQIVVWKKHFHFLFSERQMDPMHSWRLLSLPDVLVGKDIRGGKVTEEPRVCSCKIFRLIFTKDFKAKTRKNNLFNHLFIHLFSTVFTEHLARLWALEIP